MHTSEACKYSCLVDRNLPDLLPLEGTTCRASLLIQYELDLYPDGISVV